MMFNNALDSDWPEAERFILNFWAANRSVRR